MSDAIGKEYNLLNSRAERHLREYMAERVDLINGSTRRALIKALDSDDPQGAVRHVFQVARDSRAQQIAVTEVVRTSNWAALDAGKWQAALDLKRWTSLMDGEERHAHHEMHNQVVGWNEDFVAPNGSKAKWPGAFKEPELSVNCRCAALPARPGQRADLDDFGDAVTLYEDLRRPFVDQMESAWRRVFDEQEAAVLAQLG